LFNLSTTLTDAEYALTATATDVEAEVRSRGTGASKAPWYPSQVADVTVHEVADNHWPEYVDVVMVEPLLDRATEVGFGASGWPAASLKVKVYWNCLSYLAVNAPPSDDPV